MKFRVDPGGWIDLAGYRARCALGAAGVTREKREGDRATPAGDWPLRRVFYRPDRGEPPTSRLPIAPIGPADGWCDEAGDPRYNQPVRLPYPASAETLWRGDGLYDLILVIGYNDAPVIAGAGSAIFVHVARDDFAPTRGCVALARADLERLLALASVGDAIAIAPPDLRRG